MAAQDIAAAQDSAAVQAAEGLQPVQTPQTSEVQQHATYPTTSLQPPASQLPHPAQPLNVIASADHHADSGDPQIAATAPAAAKPSDTKAPVQEPVTVANLTQVHKQELLQRFTAEQRCWWQIAQALSPLSVVPKCQDGQLNRAEVCNVARLDASSCVPVYKHMYISIC